MLPRRTVAALLLAAGLVAASIAYAAWCLRATALDPARVADTSDEILATPRARDALVDRLAASMAGQLPAGLGVDPSVVEAGADAAVEQVSFERAFAGALEAVSRHAFDGEEGPIVLDLAGVTAAARAGLASVDPGAAALLPVTSTVVVELDAAEVPDLSALPRRTDATMRVAAVLAVILVALGVGLHPYRPWAVARVGRWMLGVGAAQVVLFWALPQLVLLTLSGWASVGAAVILGLFPAVVPSVVLLVGGGVAVIAGTARWARAHPVQRSVLAPVVPPAAGRVWTRT